VDRRESGAPSYAIDEQVRRVPLPDDLKLETLRLVVRFVLPPGARSSGTLHDGRTRRWRVCLEGLDDGEAQDFALEIALPPAAAVERAAAAACSAEATLDPEALAALSPAPLPELRVLEDGERWVAELREPQRRSLAAGCALLGAALWWQARASRHGALPPSLAIAVPCLLAAFGCVWLALHLATRRWRLIVDAGGLSLDLGSALRQRRRALGWPARWGCSDAAAPELQERSSLLAWPVPANAGDAAGIALSPPFGDRAKLESLAARLQQALAQRRGRFVAPVTTVEPRDPRRWRLPAWLLWLALAVLAAADVMLGR